MKKSLFFYIRRIVFVFVLLSNVGYAQQTETFTTQTALGNEYASGSFSSEVAGVTVNFTHCRNQGSGTDVYSISGKGIMLRRADEPSSVEFVIPNGVGTFSFKFRKAFTGATPRNLAVFVDGEQADVTSIISSNGADATIYNFNKIINKSGTVKMKISYPIGTANGNRQVTVDDVSWTSYNGSTVPDINVLGNNILIASGDVLPSANDGTDFGTLLGGSITDKNFVIKNVASGNLNLENPAIVLEKGNVGFSVYSQPSNQNMAGFSSQNLGLRFSNATPGTYQETVSILSNDPDTPVYTFLVQAVVSEPTITVNKTSLNGLDYAFGQGPSQLGNITFNANNLSSNLTVSAATNWEISTNQTYDGNNSSPWSTIALVKNSSGGITNSQIYVRLKEGLPEGDYVGTITISSPFADTKIIALSGKVNAGIVEIKVSGGGSSITNGSTVASGLNNTLFALQILGNSQPKDYEIKNLGGANLVMGEISISGVDASDFTITTAPVVGTVLSQNQTTLLTIKFAPTTLGTKNATVMIKSNDFNDATFSFAIKGSSSYCSPGNEIIVAQQDFEENPSSQELSYTVKNIGSVTPGTATGFSTLQSSSSDFPKSNNLFSSGARGYRIQGVDTNEGIGSGQELTFGPVDTSLYSQVSLSFKVAGFSLGSMSNGMDHKNKESDPDNLPDASKIDHVFVEISPDNGTTWYTQAKIVSNEMNVAWGFASTGTSIDSLQYSNTQQIVYFRSTKAGRKTSGLLIKDLPQVKNLMVRITAQNNALNESWILDDVKISSRGLMPKVWDGAWSGPVQNSDKVIIQKDYNTMTDGGFTACQCEVSNGATLTISKDYDVKILDNIINNGTVNIESDANFVQVNEVGVNQGSGLFKVRRNINLSVGRQQYNYISSPLVDYNLKNIYRDADLIPVTVPFVLHHNESTNTFQNSSGVYIKGRGLAVKEPTVSFASSNMLAYFEGQPANGAFEYSLVNTNLTNIKRGFNLVGNPYPSNIDLVKLYQNNSAGEQLSPNFYFWDHIANTETSQLGDNYSGQAYAIFNAATPPGVGTAVKAHGSAGLNLKLPSRFVSVTQGFMVKVIGVSQYNLKFNNSIRVNNQAQAFLGKSESSVNRYWVNMKSPSDIESNFAVVYHPEGDNGYTFHDTKRMGGSDGIFSVVDQEEIVVDGRAEFVDTDKVAVGTQHHLSGNYTISVENPEGLFASGQSIFLEDKLTGSRTDLLKNTYSFPAEAGATSERFVISYTPKSSLSTKEVSEDLEIYRDGDLMKIHSLNYPIDKIEVYEISGKLLMTSVPNNNNVALDVNHYQSGIYLIRISRGGREIIKKFHK